MAGLILHQGAMVQCVHGGAWQPTALATRLMVSSQIAAVQAAPDAITGCSFNISGVPTPCVTAQWTVASTKVFTDGQPVLLLDSQATCVPNGTPVIVGSAQTRVIAT